MYTPDRERDRSAEDRGAEDRRTYTDSRFDPSRYDDSNHDTLVRIIRRRYYERHEDTVCITQLKRELAAANARIKSLTTQVDLLGAQQVAQARNIHSLLIENVELFTRAELYAHECRR